MLVDGGTGVLVDGGTDVFVEDGVLVDPSVGVGAGGIDVEVGGGGPGGSSSGGSVGFPSLNHGVFVGVGVGVEVASISEVGGTVASGSSNSPSASTVAATAVSTAPGSSKSPSASAFAVERASIVACSWVEGVGVSLPAAAPLNPDSRPFSAKAVIGSASSASKTTPAATRFLVSRATTPGSL